MRSDKGLTQAQARYFRTLRNRWPRGDWQWERVDDSDLVEISGVDSTMATSYRYVTGDGTVRSGLQQAREYLDDIIYNAL